MISSLRRYLISKLAIVAVNWSPINVYCEIETGFNSAKNGAPIVNTRAITLHIPILVAFMLAGNNMLFPIIDKLTAEETPNMDPSIRAENIKLLFPFS